MARRSKPAADDNATVAARLTLVRGRSRTTIEFSDIEAAAGDDDFIVVTLTGADGAEAVVEVARAKAKKLLSWRLLAGL
jgi:ribosomal protein L18E